MGRSTSEEANLGQETFWNENYFRFQTLASLCQQIITVHETRANKVLEIGKGNGFVSDFLRKAGIAITTFDINESLQPDVVGSITELEDHFHESQFDLVICAEVLEHIPFAHFEPCLDQISRVARGGQALLTLPQAQRIFLGADAEIRVLNRPINLGFCLSRPKTKISSVHHWEIGHSKHTSRKAIRQAISNYFGIIQEKRVRYCPYHRLFLLRAK